MGIFLYRWACLAAIVAAIAAAGLACTHTFHVEQRNEVAHLDGPYNSAFFWRENETFRNGAAIHFAHGKQHDTLLLTPLYRNAEVDRKTNEEFVSYLLNHKAMTEPTMEYYAPYTARVDWRLYRAIDWTHMHHEQTYDIMAERKIPWDRKREWTDRAVWYYLTKNSVARSCAPLDVTMRRAGVMMKPYFTYFRNYYPESNNFFYAAHWWHPAIYEAQMLGGNGPAQEQIVHQTDQVLYNEVLKDRPRRMLLSREIMPRYSRMSPESANIFDNLHMLHGIAYDILAYDDWTEEQQRAELYRVIDAMSYQPGDENLARKFSIPHPDVDPRRYEPWMKGFEGDMSRIMIEMMHEMAPMMMPGPMSPEMHERMMNQMAMKLSPGIDAREYEGSLHDALMKVMPEMKMDPETMQPGATPQKMIDAMLAGWNEKYGNMPDVEPMPMETEPVAMEARR